MHRTNYLWEARVLNSLGMLLVAKGEQAAAGTAWQTALAIFRELNMPEVVEVAARLEHRSSGPDAVRHARPPI